jgi:hypothetical protein
MGTTVGEHPGVKNQEEEEIVNEQAGKLDEYPSE